MKIDPFIEQSVNHKLEGSFPGIDSITHLVTDETSGHSFLYRDYGKLEIRVKQKHSCSDEEAGLLSRALLIKYFSDWKKLQLAAENDAPDFDKMVGQGIKVNISNKEFELKTKLAFAEPTQLIECSFSNRYYGISHDYINGPKLSECLKTRSPRPLPNNSSQELGDIFITEKPKSHMQHMHSWAAKLVGLGKINFGYVNIKPSVEQHDGNLVVLLSVTDPAADIVSFYQQYLSRKFEEYASLKKLR